MKLWDVYMWIDDRVTVQVLAKDEEEAKVKATSAIEELLGEDVLHNIVDVDESYQGGLR